jgi:hypothetical protein
MIGGTIITTLDCGNKVWVNVKSNICYRPTCRGEKCIHDQCALYVERNKDSLEIQIGDTIWWHGKYAFWTNQDHTEVAIPRIGYSGAKHPAQDMMERAGYV